MPYEEAKRMIETYYIHSLQEMKLPPNADSSLIKRGYTAWEDLLLLSLKWQKL